MSSGRTLTVRTWVALGLVLALVVPVATAVAYALVTVWAAPLGTTPNHAQILHAASTLVAADRPNWANPAWQRALQPRLAAWDVGIVLVDGTGRVLYRHPVALPGALDPAGQSIIIMQGARRSGIVTLYPLWRPTFSWPLLVAVIFLSLLPLVLLSGWVIGRSVLRPLDALSRATQQVAAGELDIRLPGSRVREIAAVTAAFAAMSASLRAALTREAELEQERRLFVGAVVHDLRTPLFALRVRLEGLEQGLARSPEEAARYIAVCRARADALERLIGDLAAYTRMEYLDQAPQRELLDLGALLARVVESIQVQAAAKGVALHLDGPGAPCLLVADGHLLTRAVDNLLDNGLRHTPRGGQIAVTWTAQPTQFILQVADSGPGIAPHDLPHVFTSLYRGETSRSRRTGGTGLGLTIAQRIFRVHGGDLTAANKTTGGAVFTAVLPKERDLHPPVSAISAEGAVQREQGGAIRRQTHGAQGGRGVEGHACSSR